MMKKFKQSTDSDLACLVRLWHPALARWTLLKKLQAPPRRTSPAPPWWWSPTTSAPWPGSAARARAPTGSCSSATSWGSTPSPCGASQQQWNTGARELWRLYFVSMRYVINISQHFDIQMNIFIFCRATLGQWDVSWNWWNLPKRKQTLFKLSSYQLLAASSLYIMARESNT